MPLALSSGNFCPVKQGISPFSARTSRSWLAVGSQLVLGLEWHLIFGRDLLEIRFPCSPASRVPKKKKGQAVLVILENVSSYLVVGSKTLRCISGKAPLAFWSSPAPAGCWLCPQGTTRAGQPDTSNLLSAQCTALRRAWSLPLPLFFPGWLLSATFVSSFYA